MIIGIFDNEFVTCQLDDSLPVLMHRWKQAPPSEEFEFTLKRILDEYKIRVKTYPTLAWLVDAALLGELDEKVEKSSLAKVFMPIIPWKNLNKTLKQNLKNSMCI
jgi:hypothetical protein